MTTKTRIKVSLKDVKCIQSEDIIQSGSSGGDEFYLVGSVTDGKMTTPILTKPMSIKTGQTKSFNGKIVFDAYVPDARIVKIAMYAYDEDAAKDWEKYDVYAQKIVTAVSEGLTTLPTPYTQVASVLFPFIYKAVKFFVQLDKDDLLGRIWFDYPVKDGKIGTTTYKSNPYKKKPLSEGYKWNYEVRIDVTKAITIV